MIVLNVYNRYRDGATQVSIDEEEADGSGYGYRIAGPAFDGRSNMIIRKVLTKADVEYMMELLDKVE